MVYVLGMTNGHNSTAALMKDGIVVACASEERFLRKKNFYGYPEKAIEYCLKEAKIDSSFLDKVVLASLMTPPLVVTDSGVREESSDDSNLSWFTFLSRLRTKLKVSKNLDVSLYRTVGSKFVNKTHKDRVEFISNKLGVSKDKIIAGEHHYMHALSTLYGSGMCDKELLIITVDGEGDGISSTVGVWNGSSYKRIASSSFADSLGHFYSAITEFLGLKILEHEYKVMGLAPYAWDKEQDKVYEILKDLIIVDGLQLRAKIHSHKFLDVFNVRLKNIRFDAVAAGAQKVLEKVLVEWVKNAIKETKINNLCLAGGVFMNVKANYEILNLKGINKLYIIPSCGDDSLPIGCCYYGTSLVNKSVKLQPLKQIYFGPGFTDKEALFDLKESEFEFKLYNDVNKRVAKLISKGDVVARCVGRMEFGARALGNRSILASASDVSILNHINKMIKKMDFWMPFAPVILEKYAHKYILEKELLKKIDPYYMMVTFNSTELAQKDLAAGVHPFDKTLRPQLINLSLNKSYYEILNEYSKLTGKYGFINTSFNIHGEPIVCTPKDAIHTLRNSDLQYLNLGNYLVWKK